MDGYFPPSTQSVDDVTPAQVRLERAQNEARRQELEQGLAAFHASTAHLTASLDSYHNSLHAGTLALHTHTAKVESAVQAGMADFAAADSAAALVLAHAQARAGEVDDMDELPAAVAALRRRWERGRARADDLSARLAAVRDSVGRVEQGRRWREYFRRVVGIVATLVLSIGGLAVSLKLAHSRWDD